MLLLTNILEIFYRKKSGTFFLNDNKICLCKYFVCYSEISLETETDH